MIGVVTNSAQAKLTRSALNFYSGESCSLCTNIILYMEVMEDVGAYLGHYGMHLIASITRVYDIYTQNTPFLEEL